MRFTLLAFALLGLFALADSARLSVPAQTQLSVTAVNKLKIARSGETIELTAKDLAPLTEKDLNHIVDFVAGKMSRRRIMLLLTDHVTHHRGQLVVYLRLKGVEPPAYRGW